ncbi:MAG TPA: patatin-like phospholipase family protein [Anaerolineales bacterium]|nr:patatin-like phospholipase family protein [Anaerolineales bacterium]
MKPFRKNVAIAIDGGGIRGVIVTRALSMLEKELGKPLHDVFRLTAGTSTGSIIAAGLACGLTASQLFDMYVQLGGDVFRRGVRTAFWYLVNHRYQNPPLQSALHQYFGDKRVGDLWNEQPATDIVLTTFDVVENRTRFIKSYKSEYTDWPLVKAVLASAAAPTYFPSVDGRFIDGGVGSYNNPCYLAAYEVQYSLPWKPEETTLISVGTGRERGHIQPGAVDRFLPPQYIGPLIDAFSHCAADQQVDLVNKLFTGLDFRRYQVDLPQPIPLDDISKLQQMISCGDELGGMILSDQTDAAMRFMPEPAPVDAARRLLAR